MLKLLQKAANVENTILFGKKIHKRADNDKNGPNGISSSGFFNIYFLTIIIPIDITAANKNA